MSSPPTKSSAPDEPLSPIHALLGEEFQDSVLPMITAQMKVATLAALRATCKDGRRAATAEYDTVEAHAFYRAARDEFFRLYPHLPRNNNSAGAIAYALAAVVRAGRLRAYEQHAVRWRMHLKPQHAASIAASNGHIHILDWMYNKNPRPVFGGDAACRGAARGGQLEALKWLRAQLPPAPWTENVLKDAMGRGHLHILEWAAEQGCPGSHKLTSSRVLPSSWMASINATLCRIVYGRATWRAGLQEELDGVERVVRWLESRIMGGFTIVNEYLQRAREILREARLRAGH